MAYQFINIKTLCVFSIIVGTIIASPIDVMKENFRDSYMKMFLEIVNMNSPNYPAFHNAKLTDIKRVLTEKNLPIFKITMLLDRNCAKESFCPQEICTLLIEKDVTNNSIIDHQPMTCYNSQDAAKPDHVEERTKRELVNEVSDVDQIINEYMEKVYTDEF